MALLLSVEGESRLWEAGPRASRAGLACRMPGAFPPAHVALPAPSAHPPSGAQAAALRKLGLTLAVDANAGLDGAALLAAVGAAERERAATAADAPLGEWEVMRVRDLDPGDLAAARQAGSAGGRGAGGTAGADVAGWSGVAHRRLVLTQRGLLERRPGDYEVAEWRQVGPRLVKQVSQGAAAGAQGMQVGPVPRTRQRARCRSCCCRTDRPPSLPPCVLPCQLASVAALVRFSEDPQWLAVEWADGTPAATYVTPARCGAGPRCWLACAGGAWTLCLRPRKPAVWIERRVGACCCSREPLPGEPHMFAWCHALLVSVQPDSTPMAPACRSDALLAAVLDAAQAAAGRPVPVLCQPTAPGEPVLAQRGQAAGVPAVASPDAELDKLCLLQLNAAAKEFLAAGGGAASLAALALAGLASASAAAAAAGVGAPEPGAAAGGGADDGASEGGERRWPRAVSQGWVGGLPAVVRGERQQRWSAELLLAASAASLPQAPTRRTRAAAAPRPAACSLEGAAASCSAPLRGRRPRPSQAAALEPRRRRASAALPPTRLSPLSSSACASSTPACLTLDCRRVRGRAPLHCRVVPRRAALWPWSAPCRGAPSLPPVRFEMCSPSAPCRRLPRG